MHSAKFILASQSPRRKQLLAEAGYQFRVEATDFREVFADHISPVDMAKYLAIEKNKAHRKVSKNQVILTADTVVVVENQILGKPESKQEAVQMIKKLSDRSHKVISGVCISDNHKQVSFNSTTEVIFHSLSAGEMEHYVDKYRPYDKAGAYGIQEWIGLIGVSSIRGSYFNVVGMPIDLVYLHLKNDFQILPA